MAATLKLFQQTSNAGVFTDSIMAVASATVGKTTT